MGWADIFYGWVGAGRGGWSYILSRLGWVGVGGHFLWVGGHFLWVGGGGWSYILSRWGWVDIFYERMGVSGGEWG